MEMYFCMQLKMDDHSAHLWGPGAPAQLFDHGDRGVKTSVRPDLEEDEPGEGECGEKRGHKSAVFLEGHFKVCPTCTNNHGNLWLVINVLAGGLNHSGREMAQCLTVWYTP